MFRLRVWNKKFEEVCTVERPTMAELISLGKELQKKFGAYYRIELIDLGKRI